MDSITSKKLNQYLDNPIKKDQALLKEVVKAITIAYLNNQVANYSINNIWLQ
jgi:hypothetical protein